MRAGGFAALLPSFVPVFAGAFERVQQLTISLESRAFGSTAERTSYRRIRSGPRERLAALAGVAVGAIGAYVGLTAWSADRLAGTQLPLPVVLGVFAVAGTLFSVVIVLGIRSIVRS
jgi:hypothetical protein